MRKKIQKFISLIIMGNASVHKGFSFENNYMKFIGTGYYIAYFFFNRKRALLESKKFALKPQLELSRKVWHLLDTKGIKHGYKGLLYGIASIKTREKLFFKKTSKPITIEYLHDINEKLNHGNKNFNTIDELNLSISLDTFTQGEILEKSVKDDKRNNYVKIKLLSHNNFYIPRFKSNWNLNFFNCFGMEKNFTRNALVIHVHGGGFIAMSSNSHENYLRKWCNQLEVPVISIDYGLAPENPYPKALDDVWQAYNWILNYSSQEFGISLDKIILVGDSAGGNLVLSLVYLLIVNKTRLPDALLLAYPGKKIII
jgi:hormone-sensitive lipase